MTDQLFSPILGARILQTEEINQSLPTFQKLLGQIDTIRQTAAAGSRDGAEKIEASPNAFLRPQVTNNFSILGRRGSGKSSILKTLYQHLKSREDKDILLPPIVPENLESHMTLMSSLLGLLDDQIKKHVHERQPRCPICPPEKDPLEKAFHALVESYVHLQKPYQDISIQNYSTESDYVRTMSNIFKAGNEFSNKVWDFIDLLLKNRKEDALMFVFIDDIDLSTYRCLDVVHTLLGYISHPRVVTVLAGDIEIFGEALTLDFLRQEELLGKSGIENNYTVSQVSSGNGKDLLSRKKELAYEYLKKVMPPMNRHPISVWTLNNRGRFCPVGLYPAADREDIPNLQELLEQIGQPGDLLRGYFSASAKEQGQVVSGQVLYHLFDSTARGLINCYAAIEQLTKPCDSEEKRFENKKLALETAAFSNFNLNILRDTIFSHFLQFGPDGASTYLFFNNFNDWVKKELDYMEEYGVLKVGTAKVQQLENRVSLEQELRVFQVFVYLDWAARLLDKEDILRSEDYITAKKHALFLLCANGAISEKTDRLPAADRARLYSISCTGPQKYFYSGCAAKLALHCFFDLSFPLAVRYFQSFHVPQMLGIIFDNGKGKANTERHLDKLQRAVDFLNVLNEFYHDDPSKASTCLAEQPEMLKFIEKQLNWDQNVMLTAVICGAYFKGSQETSGGKRFAPLYEQYCNSGITGNFQTENFDAPSIPFRPSTGLLESLSDNWLKKFRSSLDDYFGQNRISSLSQTVQQILPNGTPEVGNLSDSVKTGTSVEACLIDVWNNLLEESEDYSGALPIYNFYSKHFWAKISDNHHVRSLEDTYKDPVQQAAVLCGDQSKSEYRSAMKKRLEILFAIDAKNLWTLNNQDKEEEDESPIRQIKTYILHQLKASEKNLIDILSEFILAESEAKIGPGWIGLSAEDAFSAFEQLCNAYTGSSDNTLANRCIKLLAPVLSPPSRSITVSEYIYIRCVVNRLIHSRAWYGKPEARHLLSVLDQADLELPYALDASALAGYTFWFHCYCRYQVAERSDDTYELVEQACSCMELIQEADRKLDRQGKESYYKNMQEKGLESELIQQIPELFASGDIGYDKP